MAMSDIATWWPKLKPETRQYLIDNNGDAIPGEIVAEIAHAGGVIASDAWWVGSSGPTGFFISDEAADWVEEIANEDESER